MNRIELIQQIFDKTNFSSYLEIGCQYGKSFLPMKCKHKMAVDPMFAIPFWRKLKWLIKHPNNIYNKYFEETSDAFFINRKDYLEKSAPIDIVLVDGLHTYEAALKDVLNSLKYLNKQGVIIMHDCFPPHKAAALPTKDFPTDEEQKVEGWTGDWCGDVWKSIVYLRRNFSDSLEVCVINTDYGLGVVRIKKQIDNWFPINQKLFDEIDQIDYDEMIAYKETYINLKEADYAYQIIESMTDN